MLTKTITRLDVPGPKARDLLARDRKVVSHAYGRVADFVMDHGRGTEVWDVDGNRYLDFMSGIAVNATGHSHPQVVNAIKEQAEKFLHVSSDFYHANWIELSEKLNEIAPFEEDATVFLGNSGTEAIEAAIKLARHHTGRPQFIGFIGGFHGRTLGALGFTASKTVQRRGFMPIQGVTHIPILIRTGRHWRHSRMRKTTAKQSSTISRRQYSRAWSRLRMWLPSSSSLSRAKAVTWCRRPLSSPCCARFVTSTASC